MIASAVANLYEAYISTIERGGELAAVCAGNVSNLLNHQWSLNDLAGKGDALLAEAHKVFSQLRESYQLDFIDVYGIDPQTPSRYVYLCVSSDEEIDAAIQQELVQRDLPIKQITEGEQKLLDGARDIQRGLRRTQYGEMYTWVAPYLDRDGVFRAIIGMSCSVSAIRRSMLKSFLLDMIPFVLALTMGLLLLLLLVRRRIVLPINAISASMSRFAMDSRIKPEPLNIPHRDEIGSIAASYAKMTEDISDYVNNIEALTKEQVENNVQLDVARRIQYGLVPQRMAVKRHGFEVCAMTEPAKAVGGDFYDCFQRDENSDGSEPFDDMAVMVITREETGSGSGETPNE